MLVCVNVFMCKKIKIFFLEMKRINIFLRKYLIFFDCKEFSTSNYIPIVDMVF